MLTTVPARRRFAELCSEHVGVAIVELGPTPGTVAFVCRDSDGDVTAVEVLAHDGARLAPADATAAIAAARAQAHTRSEQALDALVGILAQRREAGDDVDLKAIAEHAGVSRTTLYNRLPAPAA